MHSPQRPLPPLDLLLGFEAAARRLSFTKAAGELFLTQSAVSRQIQALEEALGIALFERRHKALALTEAGAGYLRTIAPALDQLREATRRVRETRTGRVLTVTSTVSFAAMWLVPRLSRFRREHPRVDVRVAATHEVVDLDREGIDVAIRDCRAGTEPAGAVFLVGEHLAPVCSPEYLKEARAAKRPLARAEDLRRHVLLHLHDPTGQWPWLSWAQWFESVGLHDVAPEGTLTLGQYDQVIAAAQHGQGIALGRLSLVNRMLKEKRLVALFRERQELGRAFHAIVSRDGAHRPEVRQFVEWVRREIQS